MSIIITNRIFLIKNPEISTENPKKMPTEIPIKIPKKYVKKPVKYFIPKFYL